MGDDVKSQPVGKLVKSHALSLHGDTAPFPLLSISTRFPGQPERVPSKEGELFPPPGGWVPPGHFGILRRCTVFFRSPGLAVPAQRRAPLKEVAGGVTSRRAA